MLVSHLAVFCVFQRFLAWCSCLFLCSLELGMSFGESSNIIEDAYMAGFFFFFFPPSKQSLNDLQLHSFRSGLNQSFLFFSGFQNCSLPPRERILHAVSSCLHGLLMSDSFGVSFCCLCINMRCKINDFFVSFAFLLVLWE